MMLRLSHLLTCTSFATQFQVRESLKHRRLRIDEILQPTSSIEVPTRSNRPSSTVAVAKLANGKVKVASKNVLHKIEKLAKRKAELMSGSNDQQPVKRKQQKKSMGAVDMWDEPEAEVEGMIPAVSCPFVSL
jgi:hypothetical protein